MLACRAFVPSLPSIFLRGHDFTDDSNSFDGNSCRLSRSLRGNRSSHEPSFRNQHKTPPHLSGRDDHSPSRDNSNTSFPECPPHRAKATLPRIRLVNAADAEAATTAVEKAAARALPPKAASDVARKAGKTDAVRKPESSRPAATTPAADPAGSIESPGARSVQAPPSGGVSSRP